MKKVTGLLAIFMMVSLLSAGPFVNLAQAITWTTINITSPTMGTVFPDGSNRVQVSAEVSANNIGSMLNKPLMLHVYTCDTNALNCDPNWYSSAPFTLTSLTAPVSVTVSNVLLAFSGKTILSPSSQMLLIATAHSDIMQRLILRPIYTLTMLVPASLQFTAFTARL